MKWIIVSALALAPSLAWGQAKVLSSCGTANYTGSSIGTLQPLTQNPNGYLCVSSTTLLTRETPAAKPGEKPEAAPK